MVTENQPKDIERYGCKKNESKLITYEVMIWNVFSGMALMKRNQKSCIHLRRIEFQTLSFQYISKNTFMRF